MYPDTSIVSVVLGVVFIASSATMSYTLRMTGSPELSNAILLALALIVAIDWIVARLLRLRNESHWQSKQHLDERIVITDEAAILEQLQTLNAEDTKDRLTADAYNCLLKHQEALSERNEYLLPPTNDFFGMDENVIERYRYRHLHYVAKSQSLQAIRFLELDRFAGSSRRFLTLELKIQLIESVTDANGTVLLGDPSVPIQKTCELMFLNVEGSPEWLLVEDAFFEDFGLDSPC